MTKLEGFLWDVEEGYKVTSDSAKGKAYHVEKYRKEAEALKALQDKVVGLDLKLVFIISYNISQTVRFKALC